MKYDENNIFAKILRGEIPCKKIYENDYILTIGSIVKGLDEFYKFFLKAKPDLVIIPCDRYEMLGPAFASFFLNIPIAHLFGGETVGKMVS